MFLKKTQKQNSTKKQGTMRPIQVTSSPEIFPQSILIQMPLINDADSFALASCNRLRFYHLNVYLNAKHGFQSRNNLLFSFRDCLCRMFRHFRRQLHLNLNRIVIAYAVHDNLVVRLMTPLTTIMSSLLPFGFIIRIWVRPQEHFFLVRRQRSRVR